MEKNPPAAMTLAEGAIAAHEMFMSYVDAGFTREEALQLVKALLVGMTGGGKS